MQQIYQRKNVGLNSLVDACKGSLTKILLPWEMVIKVAILGSPYESLMLDEIVFVYAIRRRFPSCPDFSMVSHHSPLLHTFIAAGTLNQQNLRDYADTFLMFRRSLKSS